MVTEDLVGSGVIGVVTTGLVLGNFGSRIGLNPRTRVIVTVFGVVLFTLLVQGLTIKPLLSWLGLIGEQSQRQDYSEAIARRAALNRVLEHLISSEQRPEIEPDYYRYQKSLVQGELERIETQLQQLQNDYPQLRDFSAEQFHSELLAIEADTYAEFVRAGRLNQELAPFLPTALPNSD